MRVQEQDKHLAEKDEEIGRLHDQIYGLQVELKKVKARQRIEVAVLCFFSLKFGQCYYYIP